MIIYVDDILVTGSDGAELRQLNHTFALKDLGNLHFSLGLEVRRDETKMVIT